MLICFRCGKGKNKLSYSRHKKGSSGAGGNWALRAPIHSRTQYANLHSYKGEKFCTKCLRVVKPAFQGADRTKAPVEEKKDSRLETPAAA